MTSALHIGHYVCVGSEREGFEVRRSVMRGVASLGGVLVVATSCGLNAAMAAPRATASRTSNEVVSRVVAEAGIAVEYPKGWADLTGDEIPIDARDLKSYLKEHRELATAVGIDLSASAQKIRKQFLQYRGSSVFRAVDKNGDGDNVSVTIFEDAEPWVDLDEYRQGAKLTKSRGGSILSASETRVGDRQAFMHFERYKLHGVPVIFGHMEVQGSRTGPIVAVDVTVDASQHALAEAILASVRPN